MTSANVKSILIVEDERDIRLLMTDEFEEQGFTVFAAETAEDGLSILEDYPCIDLLFTDIRLPGQMDGWDLAEKGRGLRPDLKVMYATGFSGVPSRIVPKAVFFQKPYKISEVLDAVEAI